MGIKNLHKELIPESTRPVKDLRKEFEGQVAAVDVSSWLHKGSYFCGDRIYFDEPGADNPIKYVLGNINYLIERGIVPVIVFDGLKLPAKAETNRERKEKRDKLIAEVEKLIKANKQLEARKKLNTQSHVSFEMVRKLIFALRQWNVHYLMAPFEADAQMAYLCRSGLADFAITEDQDLILYGCKKILFKFDKKNEIQQGLLYEQHRIRPEMSNLRFLTRLCILSGCDYVSNLPGFGLKKAEKFMVNHVGVDHSDEDFKTKIKLIPELLKMPKLENAISDEYIAKVLDAENTFNYQLVFCPIKKQVVPLTCYPEGVDHRDYKFCGHRLADDDAIKLARGSLDHSTLTVIEEDADYLERCDHDYLLDVRKQINKTISDWTTKWVAKELTNSQSSSQASQSSSSSWSSSQESSTDSKSGSQSQQLPKSTKRKKGAELIVTAIKKSRADPFSLDRYLSQDSKSSQKIEKEVVEVTTHSKYFKTEV